MVRRPKDEFYHIPEPPQIKFALPTERLRQMFCGGFMNILDAEHYAALGYHFVMESGGECLAIVPPR